MASHVNLHRVMAHNPLTGWACAIIRCDVANHPQACVLLIASVVMTIMALAAAVAL